MSDERAADQEGSFSALPEGMRLEASLENSLCDTVESITPHLCTLSQLWEYLHCIESIRLLPPFLLGARVEAGPRLPFLCPNWLIFFCLISKLVEKQFVIVAI